MPAGSYTCEVTDDNGCTFTTTTSISAPSAISISFSTTSALCNGGNGSSTATPTGGTPFGSAPFYNFVWTDGSSTISTSESITNRPQGNYICTVTDANGCTFSASTTITEPTPLVVGSITTSSNTCNGTCNGSASVTPTGGTSPYTYVWNTNSSANTATISPVFSGTYSVLVSDNNGCTGSSSGAVTSTVTNCSATGILHLCNGETSSFVNSYHLYTNGMPVAIHEDFTVDQDFTFNASNVKIDPGVKITISANTTLTITNISILEACTGNWQGIVLSSSTSHLIIDQGSEIHDAINGADASNGAQVDATDAIFENNQVGIYLHDGNFSNSSVVESSFDGGSWTFTNGIKLSGVTAISINGGTNKNIFENLDVGIMCNATTATIQRCKFIGLEIPCGPSGFDCYAAQGSGIAATSDGGSSSITVGGSSTNKCEFIDCSKGVSCFFNVTLDAQFNEFLNSGYSNPNQSFGVFCMRSSGYNKTISNNIFEYMDFGISLASCDQENISIESNSFNNISPPPTLANERAITLWSTHLNDGGDRLIKNNLVKKYERGILVTNQTKRSGSTVAVDVTENSVYLDNPSHSDMWYGIRVQAGSDNSVTGNLISTTVTAVSGMEKTVYGISVEKSENNIISENSIVNLGTGIRFLGTGVRNTTSCNSLSGSYRQITMEVSFIDDQGTTSEASDNEWTRGTNTDANLCAIGTPASFKWYVQSSSTPYSPGTGTGEMRPIGYYSVVSGIDPSTQCTTPCTTPDCMQGQISKIVKEEGIYATFTPEELYNVKRFAYELLTKDTTLMYLSNGNDSILRVFYLALKEGNIDLLNKVKDYLQENDSSNAESTNSSLSPDNYSEENEKSFNSYYLESWAKYQINLDSTLKSNLGEIAYQNPLSGGLSVYGARAMLNLDLSDNYEEPLGRLKNPTQESISNELKGIQLGKIFPNPNSGKMFYSALRFPEKKGLLEFYDLLGTLVRSIVLYPDTKDLEIDLSDLPAGVYSYRIVLDNSFSSYDKIILQK
ncbi:MAG: T9SS type A sorting domain-containing protein [Bacteroidetes bacterium]|nr:T9SS type A sorting domain-containing protein [Bacteroidota bacterium]